MNQGRIAPAGAFSGDKATFVVLSCITILGLSLVISIWHGDLSSSVAVLGLVSVYLGSTEMLMLFTIMAPCSLVTDIFRLAASKGVVSGHGWLVFFTVLDMISKLVGAWYAWGLHSAQVSGEAQYAPVSTGSQPSNAGSNGRGGGGGGHLGGPPPYQPPAGGFAPSVDPFVSMGAPRPDAFSGPPVATSYQSFPAQSPPPHAL